MDCIVLLPGQAAVEAYRKRAAQACARESFGTTVTTPGSWLAELWDLWGDGRVIATSSQRFLALYAALEQQTKLPVSTGMVQLGLRLVTGGLGSPQMDALLDGSVPVRSADQPLVSLVRAYEGVLARVGVLDPGRAWGLLARSACVGLPAQVRVQGFGPPAVVRHFCTQQGLALVEPDETPSVGPAPQGVRLRFAFPSGRYAEPLLLVDLIASLTEDEGVREIVVTARHPFALYRRIASALARKGVSCALEDSLSFAQTDFGRALACVRAIVTSEAFPHAEVLDYLLNPLAGVPKSRAWDVDAKIRGNRLMRKEDCRTLVAEASSAFEYFEELATTPDAAVLTGWFEDRVHAQRGAGQAWVSQELGAISCLRAAAEEARALSGTADALFALLEAQTVDVSRRCGTGEPVVVITSQRQAAQRAPGSCEAVIMCDMTSADYPLRTRDDAASVLLASMGLEPSLSPAQEARQIFAAILKLPTQQLIIERCLNDENAEPTYPSVMVEEFTDSYRSDPTTDDLHKRYSLPPVLVRDILERGEEALHENAAVAHTALKVAVTVSSPSLGQISPRRRSLIVLPRLTEGAVLKEPCFSASQIESYLECPQKWFAQRRLHLDTLDEGFGPLEMGEFAHRAFERFYRQFRKQGYARVLPGNLACAQETMRAVLRELADEQPTCSPSSNRLVPRSQLEARQVEELKERLVSYLGREAVFLPSFTPTHFEYVISADQPLDYAGYKLVGSIDRIDMDEHRRAAIIDYKSSVSEEYELYERTGDLRLGKVQSLIYAQVVRRHLGLEVVAALYVGYGRQAKAAGAINATVEPAEVPGLKASTCRYPHSSLVDVLDATEERAAEAIEGMLAGDVTPRPSSPKVCTYCPEISCSKRQG